MKIAVSIQEKDFKSPVSDVFARSPYFALFEVEGGEIKDSSIIENRFSSQLGQAGVSTAQLMAEEKVEAVISKNLGPRAFDALKQFGIKTYFAKGEAEKAVKDLIEGKLNENSSSGQ